MGKYSWQAAEDRGQHQDRGRKSEIRGQRAEDSEETLEVAGALRFRLEAGDRGRGRFIREIENWGIRKLEN